VRKRHVECHVSVSAAGARRAVSRGKNGLVRRWDSSVRATAHAWHRARPQETCRRRSTDGGVDAALAVAQRAALAACPNREDLGQDRERGLARRVGADVEAARAGDPLQRLLGDAGLEQALAAALLVAARAERADVE